MKEIWDIASGTMPEDNPGSLKQQEYGDILAYFLSLNEYPTGDSELAGQRRGDGRDQGREEKVMRAALDGGDGCHGSGVRGRRLRTRKEVGQGRRLYGRAGGSRADPVRSKCASCHAPNRFTDDLFYTSFAGKPLWEMFDVISDSMPEDNPGSLKKEEYADVIAYLLKLNNFPAGDVDLPIDKDALSAILMEKP